MAIITNIFIRILRVSAAIFCLISVIFMIQARQTTTFQGRSIQAKYGDFTPYGVFVGINFLTIAYSILVVCLPNESQLWRPIVAFDAFMAVLLFSTCSAALAVGLVERHYGKLHGDLYSIYPSVAITHLLPFYCSRILLSVSIGFVGALLYLVLELLSIQEAHNVILLGGGGQAS